MKANLACLTMNILILTNLFNCNKKKKEFTSQNSSNVFTDEFVEINPYLLSDLQNGSKSFNEAFVLLKSMQKIGIRNVVCTFRVSGSDDPNLSLQYMALFEALKKMANSNSQNLKINLTLSVEYVLDKYFSHVLKKGNLICLPNNKILVTIPTSGNLLEWKENIAEIRKIGYFPILTQTESNRSFHNDLGQYFELKSAGCLFQIGLISLSQDDENGKQTISNWLLRNKLIDYVGTNLKNPNQLDLICNLTNQPIFNELLIPIIQNNYQLNE